ncbi:hypothetical protein KC207_12445 [Phycicoccus sp. BSK3Z-2]|uniref:DNA-directed RNA polymerase specialized sigma24 family protein n=1 Tax=Phycicoccus avicenniae TaxID=2828860 RepID=A0A941HZH6_9MICO|nr:hypothetical protein [Phycicoccus avicenniae]MBR7744098.1 hypothetical protein [Phycicoccus avicenniae]
MAGDADWRRDDDAGFLDVARARQGPALRAAALVTLDPDLAEAVVLRALTDLALRWREAREEGPEHVLRAALYPSAVRAAEAREDRRDTQDGQDAEGPAATGPHVPPGADVPSGDDRSAAVARALATVPPRARAAAVSWWLEDRDAAGTAHVLRCSPEEVLADVDRVRRALATVGPRSTPPTGPGDAAARDLLDLLADGVVERDLGPLAEDAARSRRRTVRRRTAVGAVLAVGASTAAAVVTGRPDPSSADAVTSAAPDGRLRAVVADGVRVHLAPDADGLDALPRYPLADQLALPRRLWPDADRPLDMLSPAGTSSSVRAVYLVRSRPGALTPALFIPRISSRAQRVGMAPLRPLGTVPDAEGIALGPRAVDSGRHRVVFPQPGGVVLLEVRSSRTQRFEIEGETIESAGWAADDRTVVASSATATWLVDTRSGRVRRSGIAAHPGWADITSPAGRPTVRTFSEDGRLISLRSVLGPRLEVLGRSVSTVGGWTCSAAGLEPSPATGGRTRGLVAVRAGGAAEARVLATAPTTGSSEAYRPVGWGPGGVVLVEARTSGAGARIIRLLAWDVPGGRLHRVAEADEAALAAASGAGFTRAWTL